jgi:small-conductance mechanosensitive channel
VIQSNVRFKIDQIFQEAGIVIAFPQRDVHLDAPGPLDIRLVRPEPEKAARRSPGRPKPSGGISG